MAGAARGRGPPCTRAATGSRRLPILPERVGFRGMSTKVQAVLEGFKSLPRDERCAVYETIARSVVPGDHGPLSSDDLTAIAVQTFSLLDKEESPAR